MDQFRRVSYIDSMYFITVIVKKVQGLVAPPGVFCSSRWIEARCPLQTRSCTPRWTTTHAPSVPPSVSPIHGVLVARTQSNRLAKQSEIERILLSHRYYRSSILCIALDYYKDNKQASKQVSKSVSKTQLTQVAVRRGPTTQQKESLKWLPKLTIGQVRLFYVRRQTVPKPRCCRSECSIAKRTLCASDDQCSSVGRTQL